MTTGEVGRALGVSASYVSRLLVPPDGPPRRRARPRKTTPELIARVVALRQAGLSYAAIGREVGYSAPHVRTLIQRAGGDPLKRAWREGGAK